MTPREIDALIATHVFGIPEPPRSEAPNHHLSRRWHASGYWRWEWLDRDGNGLWIPAPFCTGPAATKRLRDRMRELGWRYRILSWDAIDGWRFQCWFGTQRDARDTPGDAEADTEEMAVALAALRALGIPDPPAKKGTEE